MSAADGAASNVTRAARMHLPSKNPSFKSIAGKGLLLPRRGCGSAGVTRRQAALTLAGLILFGCYQPAVPGAGLPTAVKIRARKLPAKEERSRSPRQETDARPPAVAGDIEQAWLPQEESLRAWKYIVLHHTASTSGSVESIHAAHRRRKDAQGNPWRGIGYHFVIGNGEGMADGGVESTFRWQEQSSGAHAGNALYNDFGIGICLVGNFEKQPPTSKQLAAVKRLVTFLKTQCEIPHNGVVRHGDVRATACPGRYFPWDDVAAGESPVLALGPGMRE